MADDFDELYGEFTDDALDQVNRDGYGYGINFDWQIDLLSQIPSAPKNCDIESLLQSEPVLFLRFYYRCYSLACVTCWVGAVASHDEIQKAIDKLDMQHVLHLYLVAQTHVRTRAGYTTASGLPRRDPTPQKTAGFTCWGNYYPPEQS